MTDAPNSTTRYGRTINLWYQAQPQEMRCLPDPTAVPSTGRRRVLVETCKLNDVDPLAHLTDVLAGDALQLSFHDALWKKQAELDTFPTVVLTQ